jgi:CheY-like chemotaxis protein
MVDDEAHYGPPQRSGATPKPSPQSGEHTSYKLISDLCASLVSLVVGLASPATVLILVCLLAQHGGGILNSVNTFMQNKQSLEVSAGPKEGLLIKIVQGEVQAGLSQQVTANAAARSAPVPPEEIKSIRQVAGSAASQLVPQSLRRPENVVKVLWVNDHPEQNIGLQYAFQALGMIVVCIDSDAGISESFKTAGEFDVVITDMARGDIEGGRAKEPLAGMQTVDTLRSQHPQVPVIIYSGSYSTTEKLVSPVIEVTNDPQRVFTLVANIAGKKTK